MFPNAKKPALIAGIAAGILLLGVIVFAVYANQTRGDAQGGSSNSSAFIDVDTCEVLSQKIADEQLGGASQKAAASTPTVHSEDLTVSNCIYSKGLAGVGLLARSAKTTVGAMSNKDQFRDGRPDGVQNVDGIGDAAYFEPTTKQLNILVGNNWYILTTYKEKLSDTTLEETVELAKKLTLL